MGETQVNKAHQLCNDPSINILCLLHLYMRIVTHTDLSTNPSGKRILILAKLR